MADRLLDLACVSYLAAAQVLHVHAYPRANSGTVVDAIAASVAGDGPLAAVTAARAGLTVGLVTNRVGDDPTGHHLLTTLTTAGVRHTLHPDPDVLTPHLTVIADEADTRTWFAALHHAYTDLHHADLTPAHPGQDRLPRLLPGPRPRRGPRDHRRRRCRAGTQPRRRSSR